MTSERPDLIGVPGRLACLLAVIVAAAGASGLRVAAALFLALALAAACHRQGLAVLKAPFLWLLVLFLMLPPLLVAGGEAVRVGPVALSIEGLAQGAQMSARAVAIVVAVSGFAATVPVTGVAAILERAGLPGIGFALGVAVNVLPSLQAGATTTWYAFSQRGGLRRRPLRGLYLMLATVVTETLRRADEIVVAAHSRGYTAERRRLAIDRGRFDIPIAFALAALVFVVVFL